jgi:hypothetical protein
VITLREENARGTLFDLPGAGAVDPQDAYWLEIKTVAQFESSGPFARYSAEMLSPVALDVKKLWLDGLIRHAGLLLVLFTESRDIAEHDVEAWRRKVLDKGYPLGRGATKGFKLTDRIGNGWSQIGLFSVREM